MCITAMIQKLSKRRANERLPILQDQRKKFKWSRTWKQWPLSFLALVEMFIGNLSLLDSTFTWNFEDVCERKCEENKRNFGDQVSGSFITIMPNDFFLVLKIKKILKDKRFDNTAVKTALQRALDDIQIWRLPEMFKTIEKRQQVKRSYFKDI